MFENAKVGDRVWGLTIGWGNIIKIDRDCKTSGAIVVSWDNDERTSYLHSDGRVHKNDLLPFIFWSEIHFEIPPKPKVKVKKTVEGWGRECLTGGILVKEQPDNNEFEWFPAIITYEVEE
jgi:hypothetical protein